MTSNLLNKMIGFFVISALFSPTFAIQSKLATVTWTFEDGFQLQDNRLHMSPDSVAWANFTNQVNSTGWSYLEVQTSDQFPDKIQAYAAGFLEGFVTSEILYMHWINTVKGSCDGKEQLCQQISQFVKKNVAWTQRSVKRQRTKRPYWHQVGLFFDQLDGLEHGYAKKTEKFPEFKIPSEDFLWMNIDGDREDLEQVFNVDGKYDNVTHVLGSGSCSALIKILPGNSDIYIAQDTWNSYQSMLRILKKYNFGFHVGGTDGQKIAAPGRVMSFSSYPGVIYSGDDFYLISNGLAVIETTIGNSNKDLWKFVTPKHHVLEGVRTMVANRLATSAKDWVRWFGKKNSGTYNNQWMVLDYSKFVPGESLDNVADLLWVLEQLPGHIHSEDLTKVLVSQTYWPSYNSPYFKDIFDLGGNPALVLKYGDWFTYDKTPRALIFKRDHGKVVDLKSMTKLMRYNDFKNDPLSKCDCDPPFSAENAISARNDLNPKNGTYPFGALGHRSHGGTDMKLASLGTFKDLQFIAAAGPTFDDQPPFQWSAVDFEKDCPHVGHPDVWAFQPVQHIWVLEDSIFQLQQDILN